MPGLRNCACSGGVGACGTNEKDGMEGVMGGTCVDCGDIGAGKACGGGGRVMGPGCAGCDWDCPCDCDCVCPKCGNCVSMCSGRGDWGFWLEPAVLPRGGESAVDGLGMLIDGGYGSYGECGGDMWSNGLLDGNNIWPGPCVR